VQNQGYFKRETRMQIRITIAGLAMLCLLSGCRPTRTVVTNGSPRPAPTASPTPLPQFQGKAKGLNITLFDDRGQKIAEVSGESAGLDPQGKTQTVSLNKGKAVLFKDGKPASTLSANRITANDATRTVQASGGVVVRSLEQAGAPTARADKVNWEHDKDRIQGEGNVRVTAETTLDIPAASFTGDTKLQKLEIQGNGIPATVQL
jgi:LPS export ABC transporter protein LptC